MPKVRPFNPLFIPVHPHIRGENRLFEIIDIITGKPLNLQVDLREYSGADFFGSLGNLISKNAQLVMNEKRLLRPMPRVENLPGFEPAFMELRARKAENMPFADD